MEAANPGGTMRFGNYVDLYYRAFRTRGVSYFLTSDLVYCWIRRRTGGYVRFSSERTPKK